MSFQAIQSENATLSSSKLPLAYYSEVLPPPLPPPPVITLSGFGYFSITWDKWNIPENMESKLNKKWTINLMLT